MSLKYAYAATALLLLAAGGAANGRPAKHDCTLPTRPANCYTRDPWFQPQVDKYCGYLNVTFDDRPPANYCQQYYSCLQRIVPAICTAPKPKPTPTPTPTPPPDTSSQAPNGGIPTCPAGEAYNTKTRHCDNSHVNTTH